MAEWTRNTDTSFSCDHTTPLCRKIIVIRHSDFLRKELSECWSVRMRLVWYVIVFFSICDCMMLIYGQGCDIPDIDFVVQWKAPASTSSWVQRAGRAARAPGREGLAVLLVEKTAFETNPAAMSEKAAPTKANQSQVAQRGRGRGRGGGRGGKRGASYAVLHG